jgi:hypothetical protein
MDYSAWLDLVTKAGVTIKNIDPAWLQSQHALATSPAIVAQQIRAGSAPSIPPALATQAQVWQCKSCGGKEFFWEQTQVPREHGLSAIIWLVLLSIVVVGGLILLVNPLGCCMILLTPFFLIYWLLSPKTRTEQRPRCRRCGFI